MIHILISIIYIFFSLSANCEVFSNYKNYKKTPIKFKIKEISKNKLSYPWGMTFLDQNELLITEKGGDLVKINVQTGESIRINHNIPHINSISGQGGLLDVFAHSDGKLYFTYSHKKEKNKSSTAIARGDLIENSIKNLEILLIGKPYLNINKHWGARIAVKDENLFIGLGDRDGGMIAQDPTKHPGSIIRIKTDGSIPNDNPFFKGFKNWLPEIYQIGLRNPQGIALSPINGEIYFSQHGPRGGDNIGKVSFAGNYGWKDIAWGGTEYSGRKIGTKAFKNIYDKTLISWVPSIAVGSINFYKGDSFTEWNGDLLISATKANLLARLKFREDKVIEKEVIIKDNPKIGRIRDFEIDSNGDIYIVSDDKKSSLWKIYRD